MSEEKLETTEKVEDTEIEEVVEEEHYVNFGTVVDCRRLNVRKDPLLSSEIVSVLERGDKVMIDESVNGYYKIYTASGIEGFCVMKYISVNRNKVV